MSAALRAGWRDLWRWPAPTLLALTTAMAGMLAWRATWTAVRLVVAAAPHRASPSFPLLAHVVTVVVAGGALATLLVDVGRAVALSAYAGTPPPLGRRGTLVGPLGRGLLRTPAMVSVRAVELFVYATLAIAELAILAHLEPRLHATPAQRALVTTLLVAPALVVALYLFAAARVAQTLIARGLGAATALTHGLDVALRRLHTLLRLGLTASLWTAPLWISALVLSSWASPLAASLVALAIVWSYAALVRVVGADGRLRGG